MRRNRCCAQHEQRQNDSSMAESVAGVWPPAGRLNATLIPWGKGRTVFRVLRSIYKADQFNDSRRGDARFSPLIDAEREAVIPTLYAVTTLDCALMESVFHDVPYRPGLKTVSKSKMSKAQSAQP